MLATVFRVNYLEGQGGTSFLCRNLRLRTFRRVEIVLGETVLIFQDTDALAHATFLWRHGASLPASLNLANTEGFESGLRAWEMDVGD